MGGGLGWLEKVNLNLKIFFGRGGGGGEEGRGGGRVSELFLKGSKSKIKKSCFFSAGGGEGLELVIFFFTKNPNLKKNTFK